MMVVGKTLWSGAEGQGMNSVVCFSVAGDEVGLVAIVTRVGRFLLLWF
jgi:hypothetical protein